MTDLSGSTRQDCHVMLPPFWQNVNGDVLAGVCID